MEQIGHKETTAHTTKKRSDDTMRSLERPTMEINVEIPSNAPGRPNETPVFPSSAYSAS